MEKPSTRQDIRHVPKHKEIPADGPIFLTRRSRRRMREQFDCTWCTEGSNISGEESLKRHVESHHPDKRNVPKEEWYKFVDDSRLAKASDQAPRFRSDRFPSAPASDQDSMVPVPDISQVERPPRSTPGPIPSEGSNTTGLVNPTGDVNRINTNPQAPSSPRNDRKRPNPDLAKDRRQKARSHGQIPRAASLLGSKGEPPPQTNAGLPYDVPSVGKAGSNATTSSDRESKGAAQEATTTGALVQPGNKAASTPSNTPVIEQGQLKGRRRKDQRSDLRKTRSRTNADDDEGEPELLLQPETRPISQQQLVVEVRGIYAGLVMVEAKCIDVDNRQIAGAQEHDPARKKLTPEQWRALIALHKTLLHEHHDFFLASQHPAATPMLSKLAEKYAMPSRMWRHAIHGFLEVLRHRLPDSLEFMLAFIYIAYSMIALLYETVPSFEQTWIECLGDLGRYRMSIEDDDMQDREVWSGVSRFWYSKAIDKSPKVGRLYHHLGILARPFSVTQLSLYVRSLTCDLPFPSARVSILTLFNPVLDRRSSVESRANPVDLRVIRAHAIIFTGRCGHDFLPSTNSLTEGLFDKYIRRAGDKFKEAGVAIAQANIGALLGHGLTTPGGIPLGLLHLILEAEGPASPPPSPPAPRHDNKPEINNMEYTVDDLTTEQQSVAENLLSHAAMLTFGLLGIVLNRPGDKNMLPSVHIHMLFISFLAKYESAIGLLQQDIPWEGVVSFLNSILHTSGINRELMFEEGFPLPPAGSRRPLYEDFFIRGERYAKDYFPENWFEDSLVDEEERPLELPSMSAPRAERILWLGKRIADRTGLISYDRDANTFETSVLAKSFEPRKVTDMLTPHPLPDRSSASDPQIKEGTSPPSEEPTIQPLGSMPALPTRPFKEEPSSSPFHFPKHEDTEMLDETAPKTAPALAKQETGLDVRMADYAYKMASADDCNF